MDELVKQMGKDMESMLTDLEKLKKGNKTAGVRVRKKALEISKSCKEMRKEVSEFKKTL